MARRSVVGKPAAVTIALGFAGLVLCACGGHDNTANPRRCRFHDSSNSLDVRRFIVSRSENCARAIELVRRVEGRIDGGCPPRGCHVLGFECRPRPGGLTIDRAGGSSYTYEDVTCLSGKTRVTWRVVFT
jgi:hypothetical protein